MNSMNDLFGVLLLGEMEFKLDRALSQVYTLDDKIKDLLERFHQARTRGNKTASYNLRLRISVAEGVRYMYVQYSKTLAAGVSYLRFRLFGQVVVIMDEDADDGDDSFDSLNHSVIDSDEERDESDVEDDNDGGVEDDDEAVSDEFELATSRGGNLGRVSI